MPVPLGDDRRFAAIHHEQAVEHCDNRPVGLSGASADIDDRKISVDNILAVGRIVWVRVRPYP